MRALPAWLLGILLLAFSPVPAPAQNPVALLTAKPAPAASTASADIDALLRVLQDDTARAALIAKLKGTPPAPAPSEAAAEIGFVKRIAGTTSRAAEAVLAGAAGAIEAVRRIGIVLRGTTRLDPAAVANAVAEVAAVVAVTFALYLLLRWLALRADAGFDSRAAGAKPARRALLLLAAMLIDALAVIASGAAGYAFALGFGANDAGVVGFNAGGRIGFNQSLFLNAFLAVELLKVLLRTVLVPLRSRLRLLPIGDADAAYWYFWASRLASLIGYGFLFVAPLLFDSGSWAAAQVVHMLVILVAALIVIALVLKNRARGRERLRRRLASGHADLPARLAALLGLVWHQIAIIYVLAVLVVWLANPYHGLGYMLRASLDSLITIGVGSAVAALLSWFISRGLRVPQSLADRLPLLESRLNAFVPAVLRVTRLVVLAAVLLTLVQVWGLIDVLGWVASPTGQTLTAALVSAALILLVGGVIHVAAASWVEYRLNPNYGSVPTARETTLLALFRNAFTITLLVVVGMLALSQLGVNIAPLLAGAGVLGLAIGFGAQKLVQDIITGAFIQFENAMNVGEVVNAGGIGGVVERLTIRSVSIRDIDGVLHIIPFSSVDKVANLMRHFSYHVAQINVAYRENLAEVKEAMQEAFALLQQSEFGADILEPLEMHGVTELGWSAVTVRARIKTRAGKQWAIGRAYSELVKEVFDRRGIELPYPHMTLYMGADKNGSAPPLNLRAARRAPPPQADTPITLPEAAPPVPSEEGRPPPP